MIPRGQTRLASGDSILGSLAMMNVRLSKILFSNPFYFLRRFRSVKSDTSASAFCVPVVSGDMYA